MTSQYLDTLRKTFAGKGSPASEKRVCETISWQAQAQNGVEWQCTALCRPGVPSMLPSTAQDGTSFCVQAEGPRQSSNRDLEKLLHKDSRDKGPGGEGVKEMEQPRWGWIGKVGQKRSPRPMPHGPRDIS